MKQLRSTIVAILSCFFALAIWNVPPGSAQEEENPPGSGLPERRTFSVERTAEPIDIDGLLDDPGWQGATIVDLPYEWLPGDNSEPPVRTESLITFSSSHLYIAWRCFDPEPERIRAHLMDRDDIDTLTQDDHVLVTIDTFNDERRGFQFRVNPLGVQAEALFSETEGLEDFSFDMIWSSAGRIDDQGYVVEIAIPFTQLRFPAGAGPQTWGFDLQRSYPRNVRHRIASEARDRNSNCLLCQATKVSGFRDLKPGRNLEVTPTLTTVRTDRGLGPATPSLENAGLEKGDEEIEGGVSVRWGPTPNITFSAALNPDFSQVEADAAQLDVNQRFALFFEEKRPFFLEGKDLFSTPIQAVFTRTVVDPDWGLKATGKSGKNALGVFVARDTVNAFLIPGNQFSRSAFVDQEVDSGVLRYRRDVGRGSSVGGLWTGREGDDYSNHVYGADAFLRFDRRNTLRMQFLRSETRYPRSIAERFDQPTDAFDDEAFLLAYNYDSRNWSGWFWAQDRGVGFRADSGFVPQADLRSVNFGLQRTVWPSEDHPLDQWQTWVRYRRFDNQAGRLSAENYEVATSIQGPLQSFVNLQVRYRNEFFNEVFHQNLFSISLFGTLQPSGALRLLLHFSLGNELDLINNQVGDQIDISPGIEWRPGRRVNLQLSHTLRRLDVPGGELFRASLSQLRLVYSFSVRSFVRAIVQYQDVARDPGLFPFAVDSEEETIFAQLLYSYKINPQTVLFAGYSEDRLGLLGMSLTETGRTFFLKLGYAWSG